MAKFMKYDKNWERKYKLGSFDKKNFHGTECKNIDCKYSPFCRIQTQGVRFPRYTLGQEFEELMSFA